MKLNSLLTTSMTLATLFLAHSALAFLNPCALRAKEVNLVALGITADGVPRYQQKLDQECALYKKYDSLRSKLAEFGVKPEEISSYQVLRYVERNRYDAAAAQNLPVELIYQKNKSDYQLPIEQRSPDIWRNFAVGIRALEPVRASIMTGTPMSIASLKRVHRGFYTEACEDGDFAHVPHPGEFRPQQKNPNPWWKFNSIDEARKAKDAVDLINAAYDNMRLVPSVDTEDHDPMANYPLRVIVEKLEIHSGDDRINPIHMQNVMALINGMMDQARSNQHMVWHGRLLTPGELGYFVQQYYVHVHPFYEGNGRTSRFLQELILTSFDMPHGSSGDLMNSDVLTPHHEYYLIALQKNNEQLDQLTNDCVASYKQIARNKNLHDIDQNKLSYQCRILPEITPHPRVLNCNIP